MFFEGIAMDKYEVEACHMTKAILALRRQNSAFAVYVQHSARLPGLGAPFGYLRASPDNTSVNLFVHPYDYPVLLPLLQSLVKVCCACVWIRPGSFAVECTLFGCVYFSFVCL